MSEKQPTPSTEWVNYNKDKIDDPEMARDLALKQNQYHDAAVLYEQVAAKADDLGEPFAANNWEMAAGYAMRIDGPIAVNALEKSLKAKKEAEVAKATLDTAVAAHDRSLVDAMELRPTLDKPELDYGTGQNDAVDEIRVRRRQTLNTENAAIDAYEQASQKADAADAELGSEYIQGKQSSLDENVNIAKETLAANSENKAA